jgi:hypothetical protein
MSAITPQPGSRLEDLLATYVHLKPEADELTMRLKTVTDAIKAEITAAMPGEQSIDVRHPTLAMPLRLSYVERWNLDTKQLKAHEPETYVRYARKSGRWELRGVQEVSG